MCYWGMIRNDANPTDIREHLVSGEQTAISIRNPDMTRDHLAPRNGRLQFQSRFFLRSI